MPGWICGGSKSSPSDVSSILKQRKRSVVIATVHKPKADTNLWLSLYRSRNNQTIVGPIDPSSPFRHTPLERGMIVFRINSTPVENAGVAAIQDILKQARGQVQVWAEIESPVALDPDGNAVSPEEMRTIVVSAHKKSVNERLGILLHRFESGVFTVASIQPNSHFRRTLLREGMLVSSINGLPIAGRDLDVATSALRDASGCVILAAETDHPKFLKEILRKRILARGYRKSIEEPLGILVLTVPIAPTGPEPSSMIIVKTIATTSVFYSSDLAAGMEIKSVNGVDVAGWDVRSVIQTLKDSVGIVEIVAEADVSITDKTISAETPPHGTSNAIVAKSTPDQELGLKLVEDDLGSFFVEYIESDSPFRATGLKEGLEVISINGAQTNGMDMAFLNLLLRTIVGNVTVQYLKEEGDEATTTVSGSDNNSYHDGWC